MSVQNALIEMFSGDSKILRYTVKDGSGAVIDITGAAFRWGLFKLDTDESTPTAKNSTVLTPPGEKTVGSGIVITDAANGVLEVTLDPADTAPLKGSFYHEIEMILTETSTVAFGQIDIKRDGLE